MFPNGTSGPEDNGHITPPYIDYGEDTDGDSKFNNLVFEASVQLNISGMFFVEAMLLNSSGGEIVTPDLLTISGVGPHAITIRFDGITIFNHGEDGPYTVRVILYDPLWDTCDIDTIETSFYDYTEFQSPPAEFNPPHFDYGLDTDSDGLHDHLVAIINITVHNADTYRIVGDLRRVAWIADDSNQTYISEGNHSVELRIYGFEIHRSQYDGPYTLELELIRGSTQLIDEDVHTTKGYSATDFEGLYARFVPPHSDMGIDLDVDGKFDYLIVTLNLSVNVSGGYIVEGELLDKTGLNYITDTSNDADLAEGTANVDLYYSGPEICESGYGTFYNALVSIYLEDGTYIARDEYKTGSYQSTDFDCDLPIVFSPPHTDHGSDTDGDALFNYLIVNLSIDVTIPGEYRIVGRLLQGAQFITVTENTSYLVGGPNILPIWLNGWEIHNSTKNGPYNLTLTSYGEQGERLEKSFYDTGPYNYIEFQHEVGDLEPPSISDVAAQPDPQEVFGDVNVSAIVADNTEVWQVFVKITDPDGLDVGNYSMTYDFGTGRYYHASSYSKIGSYSFTVSARDTSSNWNSSSASFQMMDSTDPTILNVNSFPDPQVIDGFVNVTADVTDNYELSEVLIETVDPDSIVVYTGTMEFDSVSERYYHNSSYHKVGDFTFNISAGDSSDNWGYHEGHFTMVEGPEEIPPSISEVRAVPDPQEVGEIVNISAVVTDNDNLFGVWIEIRNPGGTLLGNHSMTYDAVSGRYFYSYSYSDIGVHSYVISANDSCDNWNSESGSFLIATVPGPPAGLTVTAGDSFANMIWEPPVLDGGSLITGYRIYRGTSSGQVSPFADVIDVSYNDTTAINGITYYYRVSARNAIGEGPLSNEGSATPATVPSEPLDLAAVGGDGYVDLSWNVPASDGGSPITNYRIYRGTTSGGETFLMEIGVLLTYNDASLTNDVTYYYVVRAVNAVGEGPPSGEAIALPYSPTNQPPTCSISSPSSGQQVSWTFQISGAASDTDGTVQFVEIKIDNGNWIRVTGSTPWIYNWDTTDFPDGQHTIYARSYDGVSYSAEVSVTVTVSNHVTEKSIFEESWFLALIGLFVVVILLVAIVFIRKRKA